MALIIPTGASTYGDSTTTEGGRLRCYVLAQFRSDADFEWVKELRRFLVKDELKYTYFKEVRPRLKEDRRFWARIEQGVGQASIIVIDPEPVEREIREALHALPVHDGTANLEEKLITEACATEIVAKTPIAYLPFSLARAVPWGAYDFLTTLESFAPDNIRARIGGGLREARIFAARAHAMFDLKVSSDSISHTEDIFRSPLARVMLAELVATTRSYDEEHPTTLPVLNDAAQQIAIALEQSYPGLAKAAESPLIREVSSKAIDEIQAADIAAGWARDIMEVANSRSLGAQFERVWINGKRIK
jgi:hypothetical protein